MGFGNVYGVPRWGQPVGRRGFLVDGKAAAARIKAEVAVQVEKMVAAGQQPPGLATVLVGEDPASQVYVEAKHRACAEAGVVSVDHRLSARSSEAELLALIDELNADPMISGILLQLPLPEGLDASVLVDRIDPGKDVDGLSTVSVGALWRSRPGLVPCTPAGVMELIAQSQFPLDGAKAVIVGRSDLVGKPLAALLLRANATVTVCHSRTRDLAQTCAAADVLIAALGRPRALGPEHVGPGALVIDVGINRTESGLVGDVDFAAVQGIAGAITPVPGGVGPMTIACLLRNTLLAARQMSGTS